MWNYEKRLQYPVNITQPNAQIAQVIMSQYGGPDGEISAHTSFRRMVYEVPEKWCRLPERGLNHMSSERSALGHRP